MRIFLILIVLILSSCNSVKKTMGVLQESPDEYTIMPQKKLEIPNQIHLPEPNQDMAFLADVPMTDDTKDLLISAQRTKKVRPDPKAEQALLKHVPTQPIPNIRILVNKDIKKPGGNRLLFWQKQVKGKSLDATAEAEKLKATHEIVPSGS